MSDIYNLNKEPSLSADLRKLSGSSYVPKSRGFLFGLGARGTILLILLALVLGLIFFDSLYSIKEGFVGIRVRNGRYLMKEAMPGIHFRLPFVEKVEAVDVGLRGIKYMNPESTSSEEELTGLSKVFYKGAITVTDKSAREIDAELIITYQLRPEKAAEVISEYGHSWDMDLLDPAVRDAVRGLMAKYQAEDLAMRRSEVAQLVSESVFEAISKIEHDPFQIADIELKDMASKIRVGGVGEKTTEDLEPEIEKAAPQLAQKTEPEVKQKAPRVEPPERDARVQAPEPPSPASLQTMDNDLLVELRFCEGIQKSNNWKLEGEGNEFASNVGKVICYTRIEGAPANSLIKHRWFWEGKFQGEVTLPIRSSSYRTYSEKTIKPEQTGPWRVDIVKADDRILLASGTFTVY